MCMSVGACVTDCGCVELGAVGVWWVCLCGGGAVECS